MTFPFDAAIYWHGGERRVTLRDAYIIQRMFVRLDVMIDRECRPGGDFENAKALAHLVGLLHWRIYGDACLEPRTIDERIEDLKEIEEQAV